MEQTSDEWLATTLQKSGWLGLLCPSSWMQQRGILADADMPDC